MREVNEVAHLFAPLARASFVLLLETSHLAAGDLSEVLDYHWTVAEKIRVQKTDTGIDVIGNREGLIGLAEICLRLALLPENDAEARTLGNHYHYAEWGNNVEPGSDAELLITYKPDL
jgi:hypothetical protein